MKELNSYEYTLLQAIPKGRENRKLIPMIAQALGTNQRQIYEDINHLIIKYHIPIVSTREGNQGGVYLPITEEEKQLGLAPLKASVNTLNKRIEVIDKADISTYEHYLKG